MNKIELLAPAGTKEAFYAAVNNGADAVYIGGKKFGARSYAQNFLNQELVELIEYAHIRDVKVYIVINTIVFDSEWKELTEFLDFLYKTDVDALIVQDLGVMAYINNHYPSFTIHASTQTNVHTISQAEILKDFNVKRIVLAREVDLEQARKIKEQTNLEIEVFAHGALCVSYSGNCLISSFISKRSGNRGRCAQSCRLQYQLSNNDDKKYYLSTKDLMTLEHLDEIINSGIDSLKIEGRMKSPEYVAITTSIYRKAIDAYYRGTTIDLEQAILELKTAFNRDFTKGYLLSDVDYNITNIESQNHQGILIGKVIGVPKNYIKVLTSYNLNVGDSIRIVGKNTFGFTISNMKNKHHQEIINANPNEEVYIISDKVCKVNDLVYLTKSANHIKHTSESIQANYKKINITGKLTINNNKLQLTISDGKNIIMVCSNQEVAKAKNENLTNDRLIEQINKTGDTPYIFTNIDVDLPFVVFLPIKEINTLRREALEKLSSKRATWHQRQNKIEVYFDSKINLEDQEFTLKAKIRTKEQLDAVLEEGFKYIYVNDINLINEYKLKYPQVVFFHYIDRINPIMYNDSTPKVISNLGLLKQNNVKVSSVYLNIVNSYAVYYLHKAGINVVGLSPEISKQEIETLINTFECRYDFLPNLEMNCYGYQEAMIIRHDLFAKNNLDKDESYLIDRKNYYFPVIKEQNVTKVLNSKRLHLIDYLDEIKALGIKSCYLDFTIEDYQETKKVAKMYLERVLNNKQNQVTLDNSSYGHYRDGVL